VRAGMNRDFPRLIPPKLISKKSLFKLPRLDQANSEDRLARAPARCRHKKGRPPFARKTAPLAF